MSLLRPIVVDVNLERLTIFQARRLIRHKHICVNYKMVDMHGFQVSISSLVMMMYLYCRAMNTNIFVVGICPKNHYFDLYL